MQKKFFIKNVAKKLSKLKRNKKVFYKQILKRLGKKINFYSCQNKVFGQMQKKTKNVFLINSKTFCCIKSFFYKYDKSIVNMKNKQKGV